MPPARRDATLAELVRPPRRADARRNYDLLLAAAGEVFTAKGPDAPLDEIARHAGVANATLYRHFPTRRDLLVAVCVDDVESLCARGEELRAGRPPEEALAAWLGEFVAHVASRRGLAAALLAGDDGSAVVATCQRAIAATGSELLADASAAGAVLPTTELDDLLTVVGAIASATESAEPDRADRLLRMVLRGIRP